MFCDITVWGNSWIADVFEKYNVFKKVCKTIYKHIVI